MDCKILSNPKLIEAVEGEPYTVKMPIQVCLFLAKRNLKHKLIFNHKKHCESFDHIKLY